MKVYEEELTNNAIYQLQVIQVDNHQFLIFYDSGCSDFVVRYDTIQKLGSRAYLETPVSCLFHSTTNMLSLVVNALIL